MIFSSKKLESAVDALSSLPGVGRKTALRLALHLEKDDLGLVERLGKSLIELKTLTKRCAKCHNLSDEDVCNICLQAHRRQDLICVVESIRDVMAIEETGQFNGLYHVLGGRISPLEGVGPEDLSIELLQQRVATGKVNEIIMAISPSIEGETTIYYISKTLEDYQLDISIIARGISFGGELEYADELTLSRSIESRIPYQSKNS